MSKMYTYSSMHAYRLLVTFKLCDAMLLYTVCRYVLVLLSASRTVQL